GRGRCDRPEMSAPHAGRGKRPRKARQAAGGAPFPGRGARRAGPGGSGQLGGGRTRPARFWRWQRAGRKVYHPRRTALAPSPRGPAAFSLPRRFPVATPTPARSHAAIPRASPTSDESFARLHAAGWSVGDVRILTPSGPLWLVTGTNGENAVNAEAVSQAEAWARACEQARALGMLGRSTRKEQLR